MKAFAATVIAAGVMATGASAQDWAPSRYGADDRIGAANNLSPEIVVGAAELVTEGAVYSLGMETGYDTPVYGNSRSFDIIISSSGANAEVGSDAITSNDDRLETHLGIGSQIDGLGHLGIGNQYYNGLTRDQIVRPNGLAELGTHAIPPIVTRGVLLDMTAHYGVDMLEAGTAFNRAEIDAAAAEQGVEIHSGDVVLFYTGWSGLIGEDNDTYRAQEPGLGVEGAQYLSDLGVVAIGSDTIALEAIPFEDSAFAVHQTLLAKNGVYILESMNTGPLAADGVYEFLFVLGQPKFVGSVQVVINPIAIR